MGGCLWGSDSGGHFSIELFPLRLRLFLPLLHFGKGGFGD
jgi:hypothetical protein